MMARRKAVVAGALATGLTLALSGCASDGINSLPLPRPGVAGGGYLLTAVFKDSLNLPAYAKVRLGGADVGSLLTFVERWPQGRILHLSTNYRSGAAIINLCNRSLSFNPQAAPRPPMRAAGWPASTLPPIRATTRA